MDISYEEAMRRIDEYEQNDKGYKCCRETKPPYDIRLYKGEGQILVEPFIQCMFWYRRNLGWFRVLSDLESALDIGKTLIEAFDYLKSCPVDTRTIEECTADNNIGNYTTCKNRRAFERKYAECYAGSNEDGTYTIIPILQGNGIVGADDPWRFSLPNEASAEEIGKAALAALERAEEIKKSKKPDPYPSVETPLLSDQKVIISPPRDRHFTDMDDGGAAEIYRLYEYAAKEGAEPSAAFYLGIAAELNCDMSEENIRIAWEKLHGKAEFFDVKPVEYGIFKLRAEMRNKSVHRVSYLLQVDECELLDCTMELRKPNSRKKLDEKLSLLFEEFAKKCKFNA